MDDSKSFVHLHKNKEPKWRKDRSYLDTSPYWIEVAAKAARKRFEQELERERRIAAMPPAEQSAYRQRLERLKASCALRREMKEAGIPVAGLRVKARLDAESQADKAKEDDAWLESERARLAAAYETRMQAKRQKKLDSAERARARRESDRARLAEAYAASVEAKRALMSPTERARSIAKGEAVRKGKATKLLGIPSQKERMRTPEGRYELRVAAYNKAVADAGGHTFGIPEPKPLSGTASRPKFIKPLGINKYGSRHIDGIYLGETHMELPGGNWSANPNRIDLVDKVHVVGIDGVPFIAKHEGWGWFVEVGHPVQTWLTDKGVPIIPLAGTGRKLPITRVVAWRSADA